MLVLQLRCSRCKGGGPAAANHRDAPRMLRHLAAKDGWLTAGRGRTDDLCPDCRKAGSGQPRRKKDAGR